uniref:SGNH/GDSL hydrolase family protein n=1 Tax=Schlesneria paludicola TaxID=360056 RepID=A0A7C2K386_9PLAN
MTNLWLRGCLLCVPLTAFCGGGVWGQDDSKPPVVKAAVGLVPLNEMAATDRYLGEEGGLYGEGKNVPPEGQRRAAEAALHRIRPRDAAGVPSDDGRIVLISLSMSNATQEFSTFKPIADRDSRKSSRLTIVDCAQGGQTMARWADPQAPPWGEALRRLEAANVTPAQVQVAWIKPANATPRGSLKEHGHLLYRDTLTVLQNAKARFPNLQIAYLSSRIFAGYGERPLNPEPYAYEGAFVVRWLIRDQIDGEPRLNADAAKGQVRAPVLLWGPYLWANGPMPRKSDGLVWLPEDFADDMTHPSRSGREKVAKQLLEFFATDPLAKPWFAGE